MKLPVNCAGVQLAEAQPYETATVTLGNERLYMWNNLHINMSGLPNGDHPSSHCWDLVLAAFLEAFMAIWNRRWSVFTKKLKQCVPAHFAGNIHRCCICGSACQICHRAFSSYLYHPKACGFLVGERGTSVSHYILCIVQPQVFAPPAPLPDTHHHHQTVCAWTIYPNCLRATLKETVESASGKFTHTCSFFILTTLDTLNTH